MKLFIRRDAERDSERGQMLVMFTFFLVVLILFVGLGIDLGFAYVTKAELSKAVDAAALAGISTLNQGTPTAAGAASATFAANYGRPGRDTGTVTPVVNFGTDSANNIFITVDATARINTFFIRVLPTWKTMSVKANAQATQSKLVMTLVLDRSRSMIGNGGAAAMTGAVTNFINHFDDVHDRVALATFASSARVDVPISPTAGTPFKQPIINATRAIFVGNAGVDGATFSQGGLTNALQQNNIPVVLPNENVIKVVVFFTDGIANTIQNRLNCPASTLWNFGGNDGSDNWVAFFNPLNGNCGGVKFPPSGGVQGCSSADPCPTTTTFPSINGGTRTIVRANVTDEAEDRSLQVAKDMRAAGMIVYSIGLGSTITINRDFLRQVANDPLATGYTPTPYDGEAVFAPTAADLDDVFQTIASRILLRLTQ